MTLDRRAFLKQTVAQAGLLAVGAGELRAVTGAPAFIRRSPEIIVIGAGAFGGWTALHLRRMGASVTLVDAYGPGNSRSTSGDESRGIRSSYAERELWVRMASQAIDKWKEWNGEWAKPFRMQFFFTTGDLIFRAEADDRFIVNNKKTWDKLGLPYETPSIDDVRREYPQINTEGVTTVLFEPRAGVARARRSCEVVAEAFRQQGGRIVIARASLGPTAGGRLQHLPLNTGEMLGADQYVFACGPWLPKVLPEVMADRLRTPLGRVAYFGTPVGDERFIYPNLPSFNFPGVTGWPALGVDNRGFRVRGGSRRQNAQGEQGGQGEQPPTANPNAGAAQGAGNAPAGNRPAEPPRPPTPPEQLDPDLSNRWVPPEALEGPRNFLAERFPDLKDAPIVQTHACHYESSVDRNPIVDHYPGLDNVWIAGGGSAEGFKLGPVIGEYIARRVLGKQTDAEWDQAFKLDEEKFEPNQTFDDE
ncbi:MAG: FAD-dependent oxidoreductase [Gemmatimonadetes bacterium]|nr:FAD-dependent oxidoreductase [Gemmatimonadota bacterium]MBI2536149.1 FAD-dependent oxidoreductase [Gemmatimonadota bacterium]